MASCPNFARHAAAGRFACKGMCLFGTRALHSKAIFDIAQEDISRVIAKLERGAHVCSENLFRYKLINFDKHGKYSWKRT